MKTFAVFLALPLLAYSRIEIEITAAEDRSLTKLHISGTNEKIISDQEVQTFNISDENLKNAVNSHFGSKPDDVFLKNPTPWGDLYTTNDWKQVTRILKPVKAKILTMKYHPYLVYNEFFNNTRPKSDSVKAQIWQNVEETVSSIWKRPGNMSSEEIKYTFNIKSNAISGKSTFSFVSKFGENVLNTRRVSVGFENGMMINLKPNQVLLAELYAKKGVMKIKVDYMASLSGSVAVNYANLYKDHHFWSIDINRILAVGGLNKTVAFAEVINFGFYVNSKVDIRDMYTNEVLSSIPLNVF